MSHQSNEITNIVPALINARKLIPRIDKDKQGQFKYASIEEILATVIPIFLDQDLFISQTLAQIDDNLMLITKILHSSGQWIQSTVSINHPSIFKPEGRRAPIQELGSNITYMKRYSIAALLGLVISEHDIDDHNYVETKDVEDRPITEKQAGLITLKLKYKPHLQNLIVTKLGIDNVSQIPISKFNDILKWVDNN